MGGSAGAGGASGAMSVGGASGASGASGMTGGNSGAGGIGGSGGSAAPAMTEVAACVEYLHGFCNVRDRCNGGVGSEQAELECVADYAPGCPDNFFSEGSQRTIANALECAAEWRTWSCEDYAANRYPTCAPKGLRGAGESCLYGIQCLSRRCSGIPGMCGTCVGQVGLGEACYYESLECEDGLLCNVDGCYVPERAAPPPIVAIGEVCDNASLLCDITQAFCSNISADGLYTARCCRS